MNTNVTGARRQGASRPSHYARRVEGIRHGDNLELLGELPDGCVQMAYADPPFELTPGQDRRVPELLASLNEELARARGWPSAPPSGAPGG